MDEVLSALSQSDRRMIDRMAIEAGVPATALLPALIEGYLRILKDAPAALPRDPMRGLGVAARKGVA